MTTAVAILIVAVAATAVAATSTLPSIKARTDGTFVVSNPDGDVKLLSQAGELDVHAKTAELDASILARGRWTALTAAQLDNTNDGFDKNCEYRFTYTGGGTDRNLYASTVSTEFINAVSGNNAYNIAKATKRTITFEEIGGAGSGSLTTSHIHVRCMGLQT
mmetsp:Transcript_31172/g.76376  ORF Transcript_31172/g.76376 Transcript_31172/m.76376 type:complete len:162 (-) Transcript_31172:94-579(-)